MNHVVASLERRGVIERTPDPAHQRILRTTPTRDGEKLVDELARMVTALEDEIVAVLTPDQRDALVEGLRSCLRRPAAGTDDH